MTANVKIDDWSKSVTLKLPSSKIDPADRTWGCLCNTHQEVGCPYHQAHTQMTQLQRKFADFYMERPFFPTVQGKAAEKQKVVETFEMMHERLGLDCVEQDCTKMLGGHSMRLAGARLLSSSGLHLNQVCEATT